MRGLKETLLGKAFKEGSETINAILSFIGSILEWMLWKLTIILDLHKTIMKVVSSIGNLKNRSKDCQVVKRRGRIYLICKTIRV